MKAYILKSHWVLFLLFIYACHPGANTKTKLASTSIEIAAFTPSFEFPTAKASYYIESTQNLKKDGVASISKIDFTLYRFAHLAYRKENKLFDTQSLDKKLDRAMLGSDYQKIESIAAQILEKNFTDLSAHFVMSYAMMQSGKDGSLHLEIYKSLLNSIQASGDGKSPATAFVLTQEKEAMLMVNSLKLKPSTTFYANMSDRNIKIIECRDEEDQSHSIYFDISPIAQFSF